MVDAIATSLPSTFSIEDIKEIYHQRWGIEISFRDLNHTLWLTNLHGKRDTYAEQEIYVAMTVFNLTSRIVR